MVVSTHGSFHRRHGKEGGSRERRAAWLQTRAAAEKGLESTLPRLWSPLGLPINWLKDGFWLMALGRTSPLGPSHAFRDCVHACAGLDCTGYAVP